MNGSIRKRGNSFQVSFYTHEFKNGKRVRKYKSGFKNRKDAEKFLRSVIDDIESGIDVQGSDVLLKNFLFDWLDDYSKIHNLSENTFRGYKVNIKNHIVPFLGDIKLNSLKPKDIDDFILYIGDKGLSATTQRYIIAVLRKSLNWAVKRRILSVNVIDYVDIPTPKKYKPVVLDERQLQTLLSYCFYKPLLTLI